MHEAIIVIIDWKCTSAIKKSENTLMKNKKMKYVIFWKISILSNNGLLGGILSVKMDEVFLVIASMYPSYLWQQLWLLRGTVDKS